jgi:hypothetical protein
VRILAAGPFGQLAGETPLLAVLSAIFGHAGDGTDLVLIGASDLVPPSTRCCASLRRTPARPLRIPDARLPVADAHRAPPIWSQWSIAVNVIQPAAAAAIAVAASVVASAAGPAGSAKVMQWIPRCTRPLRHAHPPHAAWHAPARFLMLARAEYAGERGPVPHGPQDARRGMVKGTSPVAGRHADHNGTKSR